MGMKYIIDVLSALKNAGYSSYRLRKETIFNDTTVSKFRHNQTDISVKTLETLCKLLNCQPGEILEYVPDSTDTETK